MGALVFVPRAFGVNLGHVFGSQAVESVELPTTREVCVEGVVEEYNACNYIPTFCLTYYVL